jgi:uncharacterized glyoxalase superfamily protein PhnB
VAIHLYVEDVDAVAARAVAAGATILQPVGDQFYGDRAGKIRDPFGHLWRIATRKEQLSAAEIQRRAEELFSSMPEHQETPAAKEEPSGEAFYFPRGLHGVAPYLHVNGAARMIDFLKRAFFAVELESYRAPDGAVVHAKVRIEDTVLEMGDAHDEWGPMPSAFHIFVGNADAIYHRAVRSGATPLFEPRDQPYGLR